MVTNKTLSTKQHYGLRADRNLIYLLVSSEINSGVLMEQKSKKYNLCERECVCVCVEQYTSSPMLLRRQRGCVLNMSARLQRHQII